ncbi:hypothetical protein GCM10025782_20440 [Pedococcus ginsenosidimutans]|uniref:GmrSD restriction endonucleases N-terminal domain-containing protein n=1 Tax=Pedococcus ginsenosidimutans TaxID=490570 RepID=A0ABP8YAG7_9MICO
MPSQDLYYTTQLGTTAAAVSVNDLLSRQASETLVLQPAFQRNMVWTERQQALLIDSMLRGVPVPEIYMKTTTGPDGEEEHVVVDGQQRISACLDFVAGKFALLGEPESRSEWANKTFSTLPGNLRAKFRAFKFIARELPENVDDPAIRAIFSRLNMTVEALEPQELRHAAYTGPFIKLVEQTAALDIFGSIGVFSARDYLRRHNDEFIGEVYFALNARTLPNKKEDLDEAYATFERSGFPSDTEHELARRMGRGLRTLGPIASALRKTRFRNKSDLYTLLYCLGMNAEKLGDGEALSGELLERLKEFGETIQDYRRAGDDVEARAAVLEDPLGEVASRYWAGVSRAASDRNSRIARDAALREVLASLLESQSEQALTQADEAWRTPVADTEEEPEVDDDELEAERRTVQDVIDEA